LLDWLDFALADIRVAIDPCLGVFLVTQPHESQQSVGVVTIVSGLLGLALQTLIGGVIDPTQPPARPDYGRAGGYSRPASLRSTSCPNSHPCWSPTR